MAAKQTFPAASPTPTALSKPLQMRSDDLSGTPVALIEAARRAGRLDLRDWVDPEDVLIEFPFGPIPQEQTGYSRFVRLRAATYALVLE